MRISDDPVAKMRRRGASLNPEPTATVRIRRRRWLRVNNQALLMINFATRERAQLKQIPQPGGEAAFAAPAKEAIQAVETIGKATETTATDVA
jgi:hypothetical protein